MILITKVKDFFKYDIPYGVKNLIRWFPVIWKDRNWDHYFIYVILRRKLQLMEQCIRHGMHTNCVKDANKIKRCVLLLNRLIEDNYHENVYYDYYKKWGQPEIVFKESEIEIGSCELNFKYPNVNSEEDDKLRQKHFKTKGNFEEDLRRQDIEMLFKLMEKYIESWWD